MPYKIKAGNLAAVAQVLEGGTCFHPKTLWLKTAKGGVIITGSGNLTSGGLRDNWEAMAIEKLTVAEMQSAESAWDAWIRAHAKQLLDLNDPRAVQRANRNRVQRGRIKRALKLPPEETEETDAAIEAVEDVVEEVEEELSLNPILLAEVPAAGNRWKQINFDLRTYQQFFGVTLGRSKNVTFYRVRDDGSLGSAGTGSKGVTNDPQSTARSP